MTPTPLGQGVFRPAAAQSRRVVLAVTRRCPQSVHVFANPAQPAPACNAAHACRGMTLVELMITVVIMGVLLAVAFPSYLDSVRKGRRAEGIAALTSLQQAQERFRGNYATYGNLNPPPDPAALPNAATLASSTHQRYTLAVSFNTATGYTLTATAAGAQADDTPCAVMGVRATGGNIRYGSGTSSIDWAPADADVGRCWAK